MNQKVVDQRVNLNPHIMGADTAVDIDKLSRGVVEITSPIRASSTSSYRGRHRGGRQRKPRCPHSCSSFERGYISS